jgi:hypothetical protein
MKRKPTGLSFHMLPLTRHLLSFCRHLAPDTRHTFSMLEIDHFINPGYGWMCKHCAGETEAADIEGGARARFYTEGEAETKEPALSTPALARWRDAGHQTLYCPRCGIEEMLSKA